MLISFNTLGLCFEAEVDYSPGWRGSFWEPPEYPECEINALFVDGNPAMSMLDSKFRKDIEIAALKAAVEYVKDQRDDARISAREDRMCCY